MSYSVSPSEASRPATFDFRSADVFARIVARAPGPASDADSGELPPEEYLVPVPALK